MANVLGERDEEKTGADESVDRDRSGDRNATEAEQRAPPALIVRDHA
jgi:hypothetical protein